MVLHPTCSCLPLAVPAGALIAQSGSCCLSRAGKLYFPRWMWLKPRASEDWFLVGHCGLPAGLFLCHGSKTPKGTPFPKGPPCPWLCFKITLVKIPTEMTAWPNRQERRLVSGPAGQPWGSHSSFLDILPDPFSCSAYLKLFFQARTISV